MLQSETKQECMKYGDVKDCLIYEVRATATRKVKPEEAVRIFVSFDRQQSAMKALLDLNGRFFAGREVKASFYDEAKFKSLKLDD